LPQYIKEYQFDCPNKVLYFVVKIIKMVRKIVITLLEAAIRTVGKSEGYQKIFEVNIND
jgi:hypothetical protein